MAAVRDGRAIDTTMGFTPTAGLVMGTRSGDLDPGLIVHLLEHRGFDARSLERLVNHEAGLLALSGTTSDMQRLLERRATDERAALAVDVFCYQARKWIGAFAAALGGLEALVFTGGIGEHAPDVRREICRGLEHLGITFDGDADRALFSDAEGNVVNGDAVLLITGRDMQARGALVGNTVVATTMSNMGLEVALKRDGIQMLRASVGDKYVLEEMLKTGATLGGEQSGHILFRDGDATTGDGLMTALRLMEIMARSGKSLASLVSDLKVFPQTIENVRVREKVPFAKVPAVQNAIESAEKELDGNGRVVVRYSGTEALARVTALTEAITQAEADIADRLRDSVGDAGDDQADLGAKTFEREHELALTHNSRELLRQNEQALARIAGGTYGTCDSCGEPIGKARLQAFPRATLCVTCKQREERR
jgi:RNA polymerase-binding protein DksA